MLQPSAWTVRLQRLIHPFVLVVSGSGLVTSAEQLSLFDHRLALTKTKPLNSRRLARISIECETGELHIDSFLAVLRSRSVVVSDSDWVCIVDALRVENGLEPRLTELEAESPSCDIAIAQPALEQSSSDAVLVDPAVDGDVVFGESGAIVPVVSETPSGPSAPNVSKPLYAQRRSQKLRIAVNFYGVAFYEIRF